MTSFGQPTRLMAYDMTHGLNQLLCQQNMICPNAAHTSISGFSKSPYLLEL